MLMFLSGGVALTSLTISLIFFKLWHRKPDRLFLSFSASFFLLFVERIILVMTDPQGEYRPYVYIVRLFAFLLISYAILDKNLSDKKSA